MKIIIFGKELHNKYHIGFPKGIALYSDHSAPFFPVFYNFYSTFFSIFWLVIVRLEEEESVYDERRCVRCTKTFFMYSGGEYYSQV